MPDKRDYFVYELRDPKTNKVFYVGKGKGNRPAHHIKEAKQGGSTKKCNVIRQIIKRGDTPKVRIVKRFEDEDEAYRYEESLIKRIGLENLTNILPGGRGGFASKRIDKLKIVVAWAVKTQWFKVVPKRFWFGGQWHYHDLSELRDNVKAMALELIKDNGREWFQNNAISYSKQVKNNAV